MPDHSHRVDPDGLLEFSVVYTDRTLNHMSQRFQRVMLDLSAMLKQVYGGEAALVMPGSGTYGMEAVARQYATGRSVLIVRNGLFSYRWSQIMEAGNITAPESITVVKAQQVEAGEQAQWTPPTVESVTAAIAEQKPAVVFAAHVETASGMLLPDEYIKELARATHAVGGLLVLDCIASGAAWVDMDSLGVDVLVSAPQKGWSSAPGVAMICLSAKALQQLQQTENSSFALDLQKWRDVMQAYEDGAHKYYATLPTMTLLELRDAMQETIERGLDTVRKQQFQLGDKVRKLLTTRGFPSVAAPGFEAPGVIVSYTNDPTMQNGSKFLEHGLQIAAGVPLMCDEPAGFRTFRIGLFGLEKLGNIDRTVEHLSATLDKMGYVTNQHLITSMHPS